MIRTHTHTASKTLHFVDMQNEQSKFLKLPIRVVLQPWQHLSLPILLVNSNTCKQMEHKVTVS